MMDKRGFILLFVERVKEASLMSDSPCGIGVTLVQPGVSKEEFCVEMSWLERL